MPTRPPPSNRPAAAWYSSMTGPTSATRSPILITGCPRSGTTWVGATLATSSRVLLIYEPFNPDESRNLGLEPRFLHLTAETADRYRDGIESLIGLADWKTRVRRCVRGGPTVRRPNAQLADRLAVAALIERPAAFVRANRVCIKDPLAFFAAEWLAEAFGMKVVVMLRHPAGVISSYLKLGWEPEVDALIGQPSLSHAFLDPCGPEIEAYRRGRGDSLDGHILQWQIFARAALRLQRSHPDWLFVRHEELCTHPLDQFELICRHVGMPWTADLEQRIRRDSSPRNEADPAAPRQHHLRRASGALPGIWRQRLDKETVDRIERETACLWKQIAPTMAVRHG